MTYFLLWKPSKVFAISKWCIISNKFTHLLELLFIYSLICSLAPFPYSVNSHPYIYLEN